MILPGEIQQIANKKRVRDKQIEKDYVLSWMLHGICHEKFFKDALVFKGGTALKKCYFLDYRFSEDLDFTISDSKISTEKLIEKLGGLFNSIKKESNITLSLAEQNLNQHGNLTLFVDYVGPLQATLGSRKIKVDVTYDEIILHPANSLSVLSEYSDLVNTKGKIQVYNLGEIFIEKMCAIIGRTQPRDLYDLWYLIENENIVLDELWDDFLKKAKSNNISDPNLRRTLNKKNKLFKRMWNEFLAHQVDDLPFYDEVMRSVTKYFKSV